MTRDADILSERFLLRRLLDALAGRIVLPAVETAANAIVLYPADGKLRVPVRAAEADQVRRAGFAAVKCKVLAQNSYRLAQPGLRFSAT
jgi:hypothetical protein